MIATSYFRWLFAGFLLWVGLFFGLTFLVDPYGVSPLRVGIPRINEYKPKRVDIDRIIKPYEVWRYQPKTVFLGTSRIHQSIDPAVLDGTRFAPAYNASIPASSLGLNISHLRQYIALDPNLKTVVVELFLYNFLGQGQEHPPKDFMEYLRNTANLFVSADTLWASMQTVGYNLVSTRPAYEIKPGGYFYYPPGHNAKGPFDGYPAGIWKLHETRATGMKLHEPAFEAVNELIKICNENKLELIFILTPNHAYDDYYIDYINAWGTVQEWLSRLSVNASESVKIYSFSQPNNWVYESVSSNMNYWYDPYHFTLEMGKGIQQGLAGIPDSNVPRNFMTRLTSENVMEHIQTRKKLTLEWAALSKTFVAEFNSEHSKWEKSKGMMVVDGVSDNHHRDSADKYKRTKISDSVIKTLAGLAALSKKALEIYPKDSIKKYDEVTYELANANAIPDVFVKNGRVVNPWTGKVVIQVFPPGAWKVDVGSTVNIVIESIPLGECREIISSISSYVDGLYRINLEPSGTVHTGLPRGNSDGCVGGVNNIGITIYAR